MTKDLETILITGASQGIGRATAELFLNKGFEVIGVARNSQALSELSKKHKNFYPVICDLQKSHEREALCTDLQNKSIPFQGHLSTLVNNAGVFINKDFLSTTSEDWAQLFQVNLMAPAQLIKALFPILQDSLKKGFHPSVIQISSTAGNRPVPQMSAYGSLKAALTHFSRILALEWAPYKIRINSISPGIVDTPIHQVRKLDKDSQKQLHQLQPLQRMGQPEEIAQGVYYLYKSHWITGIDLCIDGGISLV